MSLYTYTQKTTHRHQFITITPQIEQAIKESGVQEGIVVIQSHHTTCRLWINEDEKNLIGHHTLPHTADMHKVLDRFAHPDEEYSHNDIKDANNPTGKRDKHLCEPDTCGVIHECINGHAHAQALILPASVTMIVHKGQLLKGRWQEIMLVELDHDRERTYSVKIMSS
jgi:thiamine phosphate synthase YjbQ (UPF0047 family)